MSLVCKISILRVFNLKPRNFFFFFIIKDVTYLYVIISVFFFHFPDFEIRLIIILIRGVLHQRYVVELTPPVVFNQESSICTESVYINKVCNSLSQTVLLILYSNLLKRAIFFLKPKVFKFNRIFLGTVCILKMCTSLCGIV